jgi:hypothetical protein
VSAPPDPREDKLPAWARGLIDGLRQAARAADARAEEARAAAVAARLETGSGDATALIDVYSNFGSIGLGDGPVRVRYRIGDRDYIDVTGDDDRIAILVQSNTRLAVMPCASNVVSIEPKGW